MMLRFAAAAAAGLCLAAPPASAYSLSGDYSFLAVFGDSLSDPGNEFAAFGQPNSTRYFNGRWSNGPLWSDAIAADFAPGASANYAFGSGRAVGTTQRDLPAQRLAFDADIAAGLSLGARPLGMYWFGTNGPERSAQGTAIATEIADLKATYGINDFLVFDLPDLSRWPIFGPFPGVGPDAAAFNAALDAGLDAIEAADPALAITRFEVSALFDDVIDDPTAFGFSEGAGSCRVDFTSSFCANPNERVFFDPIHPSAPMHDLIAVALRDTLSPASAPSVSAVPVPAALPLLALGLAGLVAFRHRAA